MTTSTKRLRSVAHSIGHHAMSGLSFLHPHLGKVCATNGLTRCTLDLLSGRIAVPPGPHPAPAQMACSSLSKRFADIQNSEGIDRSELGRSEISFYFLDGSWPSTCNVVIRTPAGIVVERAVGSDGFKDDTPRCPE